MFVIGKLDKKIQFSGFFSDERTEIPFSKVLTNTSDAYVARIGSECPAVSGEKDSIVLNLLLKCSSPDDCIGILDSPIHGKIYGCLKTNPILVIDAGSSVSVVAVIQDVLLTKHFKK